MTFRPKYITFDCYGTLTYFPMHQVATTSTKAGSRPSGCTCSSRTSPTTASTK
jgi:hypothetical protein